MHKCRIAQITVFSMFSAYIYKKMPSAPSLPLIKPGPNSLSCKLPGPTPNSKLRFHQVVHERVGPGGMGARGNPARSRNLVFTSEDLK